MQHPVRIDVVRRRASCRWLHADAAPFTQAVVRAHDSAPSTRPTPRPTPQPTINNVMTDSTIRLEPDGR